MSSPSMLCFVRVALVALAGIAPAVGAQGRLLPIPERRSHLWDRGRDLLYVSTATGTIERYDPYLDQRLPALRAGNSLNGMDLTPDGRFLYVADGTPTATQGFVRKIELATGKLGDLAYPLDFGEGGAWDVVIGDRGKGLVTTMYQGSGWVPLRELDLQSDVLKVRSDLLGGRVRQNTHLARNADRSLVALIESNISSGPLHLYDPALDRIVKSLETQGFPNQPAVSRDGRLVGQQLSNQLRVYDRDLVLVRSDSAYTYGLAFDPTRDLLWVVDVATDEIHALDTATWAVTRRIPVGENLTASTNDAMSISDDGVFLSLLTPSGVRVYEVGTPKPQPLAVTPARARYDVGPIEVRVDGHALGRGGVPEVWFGDKPASAVRVVSDSELRCRIPAGLPGPVGVRVRNSIGERRLADAFAYTPAVLLGGERAVGTSVRARWLVDPGTQLLALVGVPPQVSLQTPPFFGVLAIQDPLPLLVTAWWPFDELSVDLAIPPDPRLRDAEILFQALAGGILARDAAWTNCATLVIR